MIWAAQKNYDTEPDFDVLLFLFLKLFTSTGKFGNSEGWIVLKLLSFLAKHLALHGCRSAYKSLEKSQIAAIPVMQGPDDDLESFDPNEVMAKAYMNKPVEEDSPRQTPGPLSKKRPMPSQDGPLAFLGDSIIDIY